MKIKKLKFEGHEVLGDLEIDFTDEKGEPSEIVAFIGDNGTGKTKVLESIIDTIGYENSKGPLTSAMIEREQESIRLTKNSVTLIVENLDLEDNLKKNLGFSLSEQKLIVWLPAELKIENHLSIEHHRNAQFRSKLELVEVAHLWHLDEINEYIVDKINKEIYKDMSQPAKVVFDKESKKVNDIFQNLDVGIKMIGLSGESGLPIFMNKQSKLVELKDLSSGEKQLFFRMLNLKRLNVNNAVIIIDEPETSLHPEWQRKIIDVYKNIGENNQIILATHSPLILGSVPTEGVRILSRDDEGVIQVEHGYQTYGKSAEDLLRGPMDLSSLRTDEMESQLNKARQLLQADAYDSNEYKDLMKTLKIALGSDDQDIMLIEMGASRRRRQNAKDK